MLPWEPYLALSDKERADPSTVVQVLPALLRSLQVGGQDAPPETRRRLLSLLLAFLSPSSSSPHSTTLTPSSPASLLEPTLSLIKLLGRSPAGSEELGRERGLSILLAYGGLSRVATSLPPRVRRQRRRAPQVGLGIVELDSDDDGEEEDEALVEPERDPLTPAEAEALKCLCNTLTLHPSARDLFPHVVLEDRTWVQGMVRLLAVQGAAFLAGRLLFLLTSKPGEMVTELTEQGEVIGALEEFSSQYILRLRSSTAASLISGPAPTSSDILREHFKFAYNLMLQYSRQPNRPARSSGESPPTVSLSPPAGEHDDSGLSDAHTDDGGPGGSGSRSSSPVVGSPPQDIKQGKKKRFWESKSGSEGKASSMASTSPGKEEEVRSSSPRGSLETPRRSKSPRVLAKRIKSAVIGASKSHSAPPVPLLAPADGPPAGELTLAASTYFLPLFHPYLSLACLLPVGGPTNPDPKDPSPLVRTALNTLLNFPIQLEELNGYNSSWLQPVPSAEVLHPALAPLPSRLLEFLVKTCDAWFPTNVLPKDKKAKQLVPAHPDDLIPKGIGESARAEEILGPIMLLLRKITMLAEPAVVMKELLLPDDIDRTIPLERRTDLTGHLLRLLSSILLPNTAYGVGEFLYNLCDRDPVIFSTTIGYGNASGFLQNRGELIPPPPIPDKKPSSPPSTSTSSSASAKGKGPGTSFDKPGSGSAVPASRGPSKETRRVNPITGAYEVPVKPEDEIVMSEEEKEREAEKLYVLFDRMSKTGVMDVENPVAKARAEGKFQETTEEEERNVDRMREEEEREEREVEEELRRYKARRAKPAAT